ncbi:uncharacterized protein C630.12 [Cimex lectularius]|uniref:Calcineurin-like phosphoesterase domain-containing protein n=1 Tax=Cimex lectularius TaxID=79782 RepID=A0A8I6RUV7_CIMLE|nr:uncharacterized protein C630.12 [Cimex lectularius]
MHICSRRFFAWTLVYAATLVIVFEFLLFEVQKLSWPENKCGGLSDFHKILVVADPQILGENGENWIARWDSDRFLQKTFWMAYWHVKPSLVLFLGDLMDEGSVATEEQYARYYARFVQIFHLDTLLVNKTVFIPGDNDIGGENEAITPAKVNRYEKHFGPQMNVIEFNNLQFIKVNMMLDSYPTLNDIKNNKFTRICLSHMPVTTMISVLSNIRPHLIFSAHNHISAHFVSNAKSGEQFMYESFITNKFANMMSSWRFQLNDLYPNEILVPTCSYRMGVPRLGYGVLLIDKNKDVACYNILWLPNRLLHLMLYPSITFIIIVAIIICKRFVLVMSRYPTRCRR